MTSQYAKFLRYPEDGEELPYSSLTTTEFLRYCPENAGIVDRTDEYDNLGL